MKDDSWLDPSSPWTANEFMRRQRKALGDRLAADKRRRERERTHEVAALNKRRAELAGARLQARGKRLEEDRMLENARQRPLGAPLGAAGQLLFDFMRRTPGGTK